ncbi:MAG TPA: MotA/TolQ/ExbB proton channel family protein [Planctomycetota bacterium]
MILLLLLLQDPILEEAKRELAAEKARIQKEDAAQEAELAAAQARVAALADEFATRTRSVAAKARELEARRAERAALRTARAASRQSWSDVRRAAEDAALKISDFLESLPPGERRDAQKASLAALRTSLAAPAEAPDVRPLFDLARSLLEESRTSAVFDHAVRNAEGVEETAKILRAGLIFTAFQTPARVGEVFAAPTGAEGYRWSEALPAWAKDDIRRAFAAPGETDLPIDPTLRLAPSKREEGQSAGELFRAGGLIMIPLAAVALLSAVIIFERWFTLRARGRSPEAEPILANVRSGKLEEADRLAAPGRGTATRAMAAALRERAGGRARMEEAVLEAVLHETPVLERFLPMLAVLAGVAPMLGLLGTVTGMISTFDTIRMFGSGDPGLMAGGISEALIATASGLVVAIPLLLCHSWFSGRVDRVLADAQRHSTTLVNILSEVPRDR